MRLFRGSGLTEELGAGRRRDDLAGHNEFLAKVCACQSDRSVSGRHQVRQFIEVANLG